MGVTGHAEALVDLLGLVQPRRHSEILWSMTPDEVERQVETLDLINTELSASHDRQFDALDKIDAKVVVIVGYVAAAGVFLATRHAQPVLEGLAYLAFLVALGFGVRAYAIRNYKDIDPVALVLKYSPVTRAQTLAALAAKRARNFSYNQKLHKAKADNWTRCLIALLTGTVLMVAAILVQTYDHGHARESARTARSQVAGPARCHAAGPGPNSTQLH